MAQNYHLRHEDQDESLSPLTRYEYTVKLINQGTLK